MLSPTGFIGWRSSPVRVAGGRLVMKTRPGLAPRSRRAENRCVPWLDVTDYRHSSCLDGDVGSENLRFGLLRRLDCSLCPRWWMLPHRHPYSPSTQPPAVQGGAGAI